MAGYIYGGEQKANAPTPVTISGTIESFDHVIERLAQYAAHLESFHDRIYGPHPQEVQGTQTNPSIPASLLASMHERRSRLVVIADRMETALKKLDSVI